MFISLQSSKYKDASDSEKSGSNISDMSDEEDTKKKKKTTTPPAKKASGRKSPRSSKVGAHLLNI